MGEAEDAQWHLTTLAIQYHIAGRSLALCQMAPVSGNLLHHGIELILKALLVRDIGLSGVRKLSHRLDDIWDEVLTRYPQLGSPERHRAIKELDQFELLRYPDEIMKRGAGIRCEWERSGTLPPMNVPGYELVISDVDELFRAAFQLTGANPDFYTVLLNDRAKAILNERNLSPWTV